MNTELTGIPEEVGILICCVLHAANAHNVRRTLEKAHEHFPLKATDQHTHNISLEDYWFVLNIWCDNILYSTKYGRHTVTMRSGQDLVKKLVPSEVFKLMTNETAVPVSSDDAPVPKGAVD